jgi:lipopolysaccharide transport system permease protein
MVEVVRRMKLIIAPDHAVKNYWRDLWLYRELMYFLAWRDIAVRYKQTIIGVGWVLIRPAITMLVFVAFRRMVGFPPGSVPDPILVSAAVLPWQFFSTALSESAGSVVANANLISKVYFPRIIIPLAAMVTSFVDFLITLALLAALMLWYGVVPNWQITALPFFILLAFGLSLGLGLFLAALNVEYRDFRYIIPFVIQLGLFITPIAFTTSDVPERWRLLFALNPMVGVIDGVRWSLFHGQTQLGWQYVVVSVLMAAGLLYVGVRYFRQMERGFADVI